MADTEIRRALNNALKTIEATFDDEPVDTRELENAIATIQRHDPATYATLRDRMRAPSEACHRIADRLDESADREVPDVAMHLAVCEDCRSQLSIVRDAVREVTGPWLALSRRLARGSTIAVFSKAMHKWTGTVAAEIAGWTAPPPALVHMGMTPDAHVLEYELPDGGGVIQVHVQPQPDHWNLVFALPAESPLTLLVVGVGDEESPRLGTRTILPGGSNRIQINDVQPGSRYWLHLRWQTRGEAPQRTWTVPLGAQMEE